MITLILISILTTEPEKPWERARRQELFNEARQRRQEAYEQRRSHVVANAMTRSQQRRTRIANKPKRPLVVFVGLPTGYWNGGFIPQPRCYHQPGYYPGYYRYQVPYIARIR